MAKFMFKGIEAEKFKTMSIEEFREIVPSRLRRTLKRGLTRHQKHLLEDVGKNPAKFHRTKSREMIILPQLLGVKIGIYNGKEYVAVDIVPEMLGHRLGEFVPTCKPVKHSAPGFGATKSSKFIPLK